MGNDDITPQCPRFEVQGRYAAHCQAGGKKEQKTPHKQRGNDIHYVYGHRRVKTFVYNPPLPVDPRNNYHKQSTRYYGDKHAPLVPFGKGVPGAKKQEPRYGTLNQDKGQPV
jgi:hypothetical protein